MATFQFDERFDLHGRGLVLLGNLIEGEIRAGDEIWTKAATPVLIATIRSVELADQISERTFKFGLVLREEVPPELLSELKTGVLLEIRRA